MVNRSLNRFLGRFQAALFLAFVAAVAGAARVGGGQQDASASAVGTASSPTAFAPLPVAEIRLEILQWLAQSGVDEATARSVTALWADAATLQSSSSADLLDRVVDSFALGDAAIRELVDASRAGEIAPPPVLEGIRGEPFFRDHVRLWHARWLTQHRFYDEAQNLLDPIEPQRLVDPAGYFFCRAVCAHQLLDAAAAEDSLALLLNHTVNVPRRYRAVAEMMQEELAAWEDAGMPQVARVMSDVHRRLDLGRSGDRTQEQEQRVVSLLDKLLEEMEQQQQQQQGGQGGSGQSQGNRPGTQGAADSSVKGSTAEGIADRRKLTENGAWGMLDDQAEARARELIRQQFPANFLDAISRYTQKIAEDSP